MGNKRVSMRVERAERLKALREAAGIDQGVFAERLNERAAARRAPVSYNQAKVSKFENGRQNIGLDDAVLMADVLGVSVGVLAFGAGIPAAAPATAPETIEPAKPMRGRRPA